MIVKGLLGWSNKRSGLEFYRYDEKLIPRHGSSEWGELLADGLNNNLEGCPILMIVMDRKTTAEELDAMRDGIASQIEEYN